MTQKWVYTNREPNWAVRVKGEERHYGMQWMRDRYQSLPPSVWDSGDTLEVLDKGKMWVWSWDALEFV